MKPLIHCLFLLCLSTTAICVNIIPAVHGKCIQSEQLSLLDLKKGFQFSASYSTKLVHWNSSTDCCSWAGVTCRANGRVVGLDISSEGIEGGSIDNSSSLFNLRHLQSLNLADNSFDPDSSIPSTLGKLTDLRYLNLSYNFGFTGEIPIEISDLTKLVVLDIHQTWTSDFPDVNLFFQNLTEIQELYLDAGVLSTQSTKWCRAVSSSLPNLRVLTLPGTSPVLSIDESLAKLHSLSVIDFGGVNISGPLPGYFKNFTKLTSLNLQGTELQGTFPKEIFQVPTLQVLNIADNTDLHGSFPEFPKNNSLQSLILSRTNFSGVLPESIGNLKMLSILDVSFCNFTGSIPNSIGNLAQLSYLDMSSNRFSGPIDSIHWENLIKLKTLELEDNLLEGTPPPSIFSLPLLPKLVLRNNRLSGQLHEFSNVSSYLWNIDLSFNNLEGPIPVSIFGFQGLQYIDLSSNNISAFPFNGPQQMANLSTIDLTNNSLVSLYNGTESPYSSFPRIRALKLASNNLTEFPGFLKNQSLLYQLDLSENKIQGEIPSWIWRLNNLYDLNLSSNSLVTLGAPSLQSTVQRLDLHSNQLQGPVPFFLRDPYYLDYSDNQFSSIIPSDIGDFLTSNTSFLSLASNNLHGVIPSSICNASELWVLNLSDNFLSGAIPECLNTLVLLGALNLWRNNLTGTISDTFGGRCSLQVLDLGENHIEGQFPKSLINCTELEVLNLGNNQMTDTFPCLLKNISTLRILGLRSNNFYGSIACSETDDTWPLLQIIDLAHNNFSGGIPGRSLTSWDAMMANQDESLAQFNILRYAEEEAPGIPNRDGVSFQGAITVTGKGSQMDLVKILTVFTLIDFSSNKFNGSIPTELGQFRSLHFLNLSSNAFTGQIPSSFGNMSHLESLDLSQNRLSGQIPQQLAKLNFLSFLNVSNNQLVGRIPTSTQFSTFPRDSFTGNKGLTGPPLTEEARAESSPTPPFIGGLPNPRDNGIDWDVISVEIGFAVGFGIAIASLVFCSRWSKCYYRTMYKILVKIFPQLEERVGYHRRHVHVRRTH